MYCPNCAKEINPDLHYCNGCGFRLDRPAEMKGGSMVGKIASAAGFIGVAGIVGFIFLISLLLRSDVEQPVVIIISAIYMGAVFGLCAYTLSFIKYLQGSTEKDAGPPVAEHKATNELGRGATNQLEEPKERPASVVEHTTRTLDKVPVNKD